MEVEELRGGGHRLLGLEAGFLGPGQRNGLGSDDK